MSVSLQTQKVYCSREKVMKPISLTLCCTFLLVMILIFKIWVNMSIVDLGYDMSSLNKRSDYLKTAKSELELQQSLLLRADRIKYLAKAELGLDTLSPAQAVSLYVD